MCRWSFDVSSAASWNVRGYPTCFIKMQVSANSMSYLLPLLNILVTLGPLESNLYATGSSSVPLQFPKTEFQSCIMGHPIDCIICRPSDPNEGGTQEVYRLYPLYTAKHLCSILTDISGSEMCIITKLSDFMDFS